MKIDRKQKYVSRLMIMLKEDIRLYAEILDADVKLSQTKAKLAEDLASYIRTEGEYWIRKLPIREVILLNQLLEQGKGGKLETNPQVGPTILEQLGLMESERAKDGCMTYALTDEIFEAVKKGMPNAWAAIMAMNYPIYERYARGFLNLYGILPLEFVSDMICTIGEELEEEKFYADRNPRAFIRESLVIQYNIFETESERFVFSECMEDPESLFEEQGRRFKELGGLKFYSAEEVFAAGGNCDTDIPCMDEDFVKNLLDHLKKRDIPEDVAKYFLHAIWRNTQEGENNNTVEIIKMFSTGMGSIEEINAFAQLIMDFQNNIPKWRLLGRSSEEVYKEHSASTRPQFSNQASTGSPFSKVGRNDPCPCGSGKKYKNCHGKTLS